MQAITQALYWTIAFIGVVGGLAAVAAPSAVIPHAAAGSLASHLVREQGAEFVFIGLVAAWCARHAAARRAAHYAFLVFTALFAGIHWIGYASSGAYIGAAIVNTVPFLAFVLTLPAVTRAAAVTTVGTSG